MEQIINATAVVTMIAGMAAIVSASAALIIWTVRSIIRWVVEMRYAVSVKYYIQDTHKRIVDYDRRIRAVEKAIIEAGRKEH